MEVEVPGTPEEVWRKIATGPGICSWFVPTEFRSDGTILQTFGPGLEAVSTLKESQPPYRFVTESLNFGPEGPPVASEWTVEARSGDSCIVRLVQSFFASTDDWDNQLERDVSGWSWFFRVLKNSLTHFPGRPAAPFRVMSMTGGPVTEAWRRLVGSLGLPELTAGARVAASGNVPSLAGVVTQVQTADNGHPHGLQLLLDQPGPGLLAMFAHTCGEQVLIVLDFYLYGEAAAATAAREQPRWQAWIGREFPTT
jgi:hypothetical protein